MKRLGLVLLVVLSMGVVSPLGAAEPTRDQTLIIGKVSGNPKKQYPRLEALATYLAGQLKGQGILKGAAVVASSNDEMIALLQAGEVDLVTETPLSAFVLEKKAGAKVFLREWKKGVPSYHTVLFAQQGSTIRGVDDLKGQRIVFQDPGSTSGFLLPLALLRNAGLDLVELSPEKATPPADKVGYVFAKGERSSLAWVVNGFVEAGAFSNLDWDDFSESNKLEIEKVRIFTEGKPFVRSILMARPGMKPDLEAALKDALLKTHETEAGAAILKIYFKVARFDEFIGKAKEDLKSARQTYAQIKDKVE